MARQIKLHRHQESAYKECVKVIREEGICYLAGEVRTGKTFVAFRAALEFGSNILFITKKKAIPDIERQFKETGYAYSLTVTNFEALHNINKQLFSLVVIDEAHTLGAFPKPPKRARQIREIVIRLSNGRCLLLSGTPSPESYSQLFHQLWACNYGGWRGYRNFYKWAKDYVNIKQMHFGPLPINDYSEAREDMIRPVLDDVMVMMTQEDAGFKGKVLEQVHTVKLKPSTRVAIEAIRKDGVYEPLNLVALSGAQRMSLIHQLCSGTVIDGMGGPRTVDKSKVKYITETWPNKKLAIFYCYVEEGELLRMLLGPSTDNPEIFRRQNVNFICQIRAGQEGTDLRAADVLIFYNISYSAAAYFQARARQQHRDAKDITVHWLFSDHGFERKVYNLIHNGKKRYTLSHFRKDYTDTGGQKVTFRRVARD